MAVQSGPPWTPVVGGVGGQLGGQPQGSWTGNLGGVLAGKAKRGSWFAMADTHSHGVQVHRHEHTHVTHYLRHGQQWEQMDTSHVHEHHHAAVSHAHEPPPGPRQGAWREAHIYDREQPAESPAYADRSCRRPGTGAADVRPGPERP
jgi:hypothetical protein